jgi:BASS family bile acid:Na+ symporter
MDPATIVKLLIIGGIVLNVISIGVRAQPRDALYMLHHPDQAGRALLAMFVLVPAFVLLLAYVLELSRPVAALLLALSVAPMPPLLSKKEVEAGGGNDYAIGLQVLATLVSLIAVPLMLFIASRVFGRSLVLDIGSVAKVLAITVAAPLAIGMALGTMFPAARAPVGTWASRIGWIALGIGALVLVAARWPDIVGQLGGGTLLLTVVVVGFALFAGHRLGGPDSGNRRALAITCAARHPGVGITIAAGLFPAESAAIQGVAALFWLTSFGMAIPYLKWGRKRA